MDAVLKKGVEVTSSRTIFRIDWVLPNDFLPTSLDKLHFLISGEEHEICAPRV